MKMINAYIKPHKLAEVTLALREVKGLPGVSIYDVRGFGAQDARSDKPDFSAAIADYVSHVKLEIVCPTDMIAELVRIIVSAASTGLRGDGLVYVTTVEGAVRISEGSRGLLTLPRASER